MYIVIAIIVFGILIASHELGHFTVAKLCGVKVNEFAIGMGPKIIGWKSKKYETDFSIRAVPLGGFCAFYGEDDTTGESKDDPRAFPKQNVWKRMFVILMGPMMNLVLAFVVATCFFWANGVEVQTGVDPYIVEVAAAGPAHSAGLQADDIITEINGVNMLDGTQTTLFNTIGNWKEGDAPLKMTVRRGEETFETEMTPFWDEEEGKMRIGVIIGGKVLTETQPVSFLEGIQYSWQLCVNVSGTILNLVKRLVTTGQGLEDTAGPVGIISEVSQRVQRNGIKEFISLLAMLSINLGLMNLLPIPGLDGSRLVFGLVEIVRRKPVPAEKEAMVHMAGMVLLFGFILFVTYRDIVRLF